MNKVHYTMSDEFSYICAQLKINPPSFILNQLQGHGNGPPGTLQLSSRTCSIPVCQAINNILIKTDCIFHLDLTDCLLTQDCLLLLLSGLYRNVSVHTLSLKGNNLCGISVAELGNLLSENKTIKRLSLEWNCITADINSFQTFSSGLGVNSGLEYLDLRNNQLSHVAVSFLVKALETNSSLKYLDLRWNNIGAVGGNCILEALNTNRSLLKIELQGTHVPKETCNLIESSLQSNMEKVHLGPDLGLIKEKTGRERIKEKELSIEMLRSKGAPEIEDDLNGNTRFRTTDLANHKIERDHRTINGEHRTSSRTSDREERTSSRTSDRGNEHRIPNNEIRITNREQRRTERWCRRRKVGYRKDERETRSMDREAKHDYDSNRISRSMEFECEEELRPSIQGFELSRLSRSVEEKSCDILKLSAALEIIQAELKEEREKVRKLELQENARNELVYNLRSELVDQENNVSRILRDRESLLRDEWRDQVSRMRDEWREDEERIREDWIREENKIKRICEERGLQIAQLRSRLSAEMEKRVKCTEMVVKEREQMEDRRDQMDKEKKKMEEEKKEMEEEKKEMEEEREEIQKEREEMINKLTFMEEDQEKYRIQCETELEGLLKEVREKEAMVSTLRATARDLEENCIDWRTRYDELEQKYEYIQVNWEKNCQESTGTSSAETTPIQDEKKKLQKEKESLRKEKDMLLGEKKIITKEKRALQKERENFKKEIKLVQEENKKKMKNDQEKLKNEQEKMKEEKKRMEKEKKDVDIRIRILEERIDGLEEEKRVWEEANVELETQLDETRAEMLNIQEVLDTQENQLREQTAKYSLLLVKLREEEEEGRRLKEKVRKKDELIRRKEQDWKRMEDSLRVQVDEMNLTLKELQSLVQEKENIIKDIKIEESTRAKSLYQALSSYVTETSSCIQPILDSSQSREPERQEIPSQHKHVKIPQTAYSMHAVPKGKETNGKATNGKATNGKATNGKATNRKKTNEKEITGKETTGKETNGNDPNIIDEINTNGHPSPGLTDEKSSSDTTTLSEETTENEPGTESAAGTSLIKHPSEDATRAVSTDLDLENGNLNLDSDGVHI